MDYKTEGGLEALGPWLDQVRSSLKGPTPVAKCSTGMPSKQEP
jgi:hypothetical protein